MSTLANPVLPLVADGDREFRRVDTFHPAHALEPGTLAEAINQRFDDGQTRPRYSVNRQPWGIPTMPNVLDTGTAIVVSGQTIGKTLSGFVIGKPYYYVKGKSTELTTGKGSGPSIPHPTGTRIAAGSFTATQKSYYVWGTDLASTKVWYTPNPCAFARFNDPNGADTLVLVTDDWRSAAGEDGGRGRAWCIRSGQGPEELSLNGHDVWGPARLVPCNTGLALIRQGDERHYFSAAAVAASAIQLNVAPNWNDGDAVLFVADTDSYFLGASVPQTQGTYYVKKVATNKAELYTSAALGTKLAFTGANGRFYLERRSSAPGFYGNGAPPLLAQPNATGSTVFELSFLAVPVDVAITNTSATTHVLTAPNHRLSPGDGVEVTGIGGVTAVKCAYPVSNHEIKLYDTELQALAGGATGLVHLTTGGQSGTLRRTGASGLPMPCGREGYYTSNSRLIVINGRDRLAISDPNDPLHFTPFTATLPANLGEADEVTALVELGNDTVLIWKTNSILALGNFSRGPSAWTLTRLSQEYGNLAPLATVQAGKDAWGFGRKGVVSIIQTELGALQSTALPVSREMKRYLDQVDWRRASGATAAVWNNRFFLAVPLKGQTGGAALNNGVLVHNFLNMESRNAQEPRMGWEGLWQGDALNVYAWALHNVNGEERLCFVDYNCQVNFLGDGWTDTGDKPIQTRVATRLYTGGVPGNKLWLKADVTWDTQAPKLTVSAATPGYGETQVLLEDKEYDPEKYLADGVADYVPATATAAQFDAPHREDYSATADELTVATLDAHQNITEPLRLRANDWAVQIIVENVQGSARIQSVWVEGVSRNSNVRRT